MSKIDKVLFSCAVLLTSFVIAFVIYSSNNVDAIPVASSPQYTEIVDSPCVVASFSATDGGAGCLIEYQEGFDAGSGVTVMRVGGRYRVYANVKTYLARGHQATTSDIPVAADQPEEFSFSSKNYGAPSNVATSTICGLSTSGTATVNFCKINTKQ